VLAAGSPDDHAKLLPELASGRRVATLAVFEPGARWDWRAPATRARAGRGGFRLDGAKAPVADALEADWLLVSARDEAGALGVFLAEAGAPGLVCEPRGSADGTRREAELRLRDVPARRLGSGDAAPALAATLDRVAIGLVADGVGAAGRALELAVAHARERVQFGQPIGAFQAVQHRLADMLQDLELGRAAAYYALWAADAADAAERRRAAALAKAFASDAFPRIGEGAIQVFGGLGVTWEHDVQLYYKRLLGLRHACGDADHHLETLARIAVDGDAHTERA
jgi:acyl-CoA dehydrogenase